MGLGTAVRVHTVQSRALGCKLQWFSWCDKHQLPRLDSIWQACYHYTTATCISLTLLLHDNGCCLVMWMVQFSWFYLKLRFVHRYCSWRGDSCFFSCRLSDARMLIDFFFRLYLRNGGLYFAGNTLILCYFVWFKTRLISGKKLSS